MKTHPRQRLGKMFEKSGILMFRSARGEWCIAKRDTSFINANCITGKIYPICEEIPYSLPDDEIEKLYFRGVMELELL